ncbi:UNKNOWN [Stylonychia lemnae]|uniref:Uncharacterized protein n=1 Tax=Stylonychia lemnae TaxID=5949 RepID=A0A078B826_STYLE|nr:UNKNOWN [Stylonychia lemnae]|eukprot:CDW89723.1 UNKNOWN [Stylonychia lemnae]
MKISFAIALFAGLSITKEFQGINIMALNSNVPATNFQANLYSTSDTLAQVDTKNENNDQIMSDVYHNANDFFDKTIEDMHKNKQNMDNVNKQAQDIVENMKKSSQEMVDRFIEQMKEQTENNEGQQQTQTQTQTQQNSTNEEEKPQVIEVPTSYETQQNKTNSYNSSSSSDSQISNQENRNIEKDNLNKQEEQTEQEQIDPAIKSAQDALNQYDQQIQEMIDQINKNHDKLNSNQPSMNLVSLEVDQISSSEKAKKNSIKTQIFKINEVKLERRQKILVDVDIETQL